LDVEKTIAARAPSVLDFECPSMSAAARSRADSPFSDQIAPSSFLEVLKELIGSDGGCGRS
jgi:hypothetical protein